jgi:predicted RNA-binding protein YlxR (DUF448 family)
MLGGLRWRFRQSRRKRERSFHRTYEHACGETVRRMFHQDMSSREVQHDQAVQGDVRQPTTARVRTCVGCGERVELQRSEVVAVALVRLVLGPDGEVAVDTGSGGFGRGIHVHPRPLCVERAALRGIARAAKAKATMVWQDESASSEATEATDGLSGTTKSGLVPLEPSSLARAIVRSLERRAHGLLIAAARAHKVALGADAVTGAVARGQARLVVVATDAAAAAELSAVRRAVAEGYAVAWGTKQVLAASCSPAASSKRSGGLGVIAIDDDRIAAAFRAAAHAASALSTLSSGTMKRSSGALLRRQKAGGADVGDSVVDAACGSELSILERGA